MSGTKLRQLFDHADPTGERPLRNVKRKHRRFCGRGDCPKKYGGRLPTCKEIVARAQAWEVSARKAEIGKQRVIAEYARVKAENEELRVLVRHLFYCRHREGRGCIDGEHVQAARVANGGDS